MTPRPDTSVVPNATHTDSPSPRIGWVFEGGGAKGAHSFAAAEVLISAGIPVHAVSGTSVGALNALLVSSGAMEKGRELWTHLKQDDALPFRNATGLARLVAAVLLVLHSFRWTLAGRRGWVTAGPVRRALERAVLGLVFLPFWCIPLSIWLSTEPGWTVRIGSILIALIIAAGIAMHTSEGADEREHRQLVAMANGLNASCFLAVIFGVPVAALISIFKGNTYPLSVWIHEPALVGVLANFAFTFIRGAFPNAASLSNHPLRAQVTELLAGRSLSVPTYVTVAFEHAHIDPDYPTVAAVQFDETSPPHYYVESRTEHVPLYIRVDDIDPAKIIDAALASAALPFGLVEPVTWMDRKVVDGGVADNVPIRPLVDATECDVLVIFRLNPHETPGLNDLVSTHSDPRLHWQRTWRMEDLVSFDRSTIDDGYDWRRHVYPERPYDVPFRAIPSCWPEIVSIVPAESLGDLLDFSAQAVARRFELGAEAARFALPNILEAIAKRRGKIATAEPRDDLPPSIP